MAMGYWGDVLPAAQLTGYARAELELADDNSLARYLPNSYIDDIAVELDANGEGGLEIAEALYRAYDAEPEMAGGDRGESFMIKLPAVGQKTPISEYAQLRIRGQGGAGMTTAITRAMRRVVRATANTTDRQRAHVLVNGRAMASQRNFRFDDDFGRDARLTATAPALWTDRDVDRLDTLKVFRDVYETVSEATPGAIVMDRDAWNAFLLGSSFQVDFSNGMTRPASEADVRAFAIASGLPPIEVVSSRTAKGPILPSGTVLMLPAPGDPNDPDSTDLGTTVWGTSLSSMEDDYEIPDDERPGIVAIAERNSSVPHIAQVTADAINLPVLANPNLSSKLQVL